MINNRQVNLWRGSDTPPTVYHIWIKDKKLWMYDGEKWIVFIDSISVIDNIQELYDGLQKLNGSTVNGKPVLENPVLSASDLKVGKNLNYITATQSILDALEVFDSQFKEGYPINVTESGGTVKITVGTDSFSISTAGALSVSSGQNNKVILNSNALTSINTDEPLKWVVAENKLIHLESGVTPGSYGQGVDDTNANTFSVPKITLNKTGHVTNVESKTVTIRDYVKQLSPSQQNNEKRILLAYSDSSLEQNQPVRMANGLTYNDSDGTLKTPGKVVSGGIEVTGNVVVVGGTIKGNIEGNVTGTAQPRIHLATDGTYGIASTSLYGHIRLQDDFVDEEPLPSNTNNEASNPNVADGQQAIAASPKMVWNALQIAKTYSDNNKPKIQIESGDTTVDISSGYTLTDDFILDNNKLEINWKEF